ncbi:MAG: hypothetical protein N3B01_06100, partial [Verrucomicrobiae bacterium]|nr:hypothetical protein [Verrucomicrobiae bacterium]
MKIRFDARSSAEAELMQMIAQLSDELESQGSSEEQRHMLLQRTQELLQRESEMAPDIERDLCTLEELFKKNLTAEEVAVAYDILETAMRFDDFLAFWKKDEPWHWLLRAVDLGHFALSRFGNAPASVPFADELIKKVGKVCACALKKLRSPQTRTPKEGKTARDEGAPFPPLPGEEVLSLVEYRLRATDKLSWSVVLAFESVIAYAETVQGDTALAISLENKVSARQFDFMVSNKWPVFDTSLDNQL